jgi:GDPmannose 4,6-dehydratase
MDKKTVFISGVSGQDGSLMVDYLLTNTDFIIYGGIRKTSKNVNIEHIKSDRFFLIEFDLLNKSNIHFIFKNIQPDYFINFSAQSFVGSSWDCSKELWDTNTGSLIHILNSIIKYKPECRLYQAGSSEEFGDVSYVPQDENHPCNPKNPYGASKVASRQLIKIYRNTYKLYAVQGWLFNHEGIRRGENFVTRKITKNVVRIYREIQRKKEIIEPLELGNIYSKRDWSDAEDFIEGIWKMLHQDTIKEQYTIPEDYVFSSEKTHSIKEFVEMSFNYLGIYGYWENTTSQPENEKFYYDVNGTILTLVKINLSFYRNSEISISLGNSLKARTELKWFPKTSFKELVKKMIDNDLKQFAF